MQVASPPSLRRCANERRSMLIGYKQVALAKVKIAAAGREE